MEQKAAIKNINNNNVQVFYADCCCLHNQILFDKFYNLLPDFRKKLVDNYVFQKDKVLSVGA